MRQTLERIEARTIPDGDCLIWTGATAGKGYPVAADDRERYVHRLVLLLDGRPLAPGEQARHLCGRAACVNRQHITAGDQAANEADKITTGTYRHGRPGVTHCGRYLPGQYRCRRPPHSGPCTPETYSATSNDHQPPTPSSTGSTETTEEPS